MFLEYIGKSTKDTALGQFISFIHCQNVPLDEIRIIDADKQEFYELKTIRYYTFYKILK